MTKGETVGLGLHWFQYEIVGHAHYSFFMYLQSHKILHSLYTINNHHHGFSMVDA